MEESDNLKTNNLENGDENIKQPKSFFGKLTNTVKKAAKFVGDNVNKGIKNVKKSIDEHQKQKEIEEKIKEKFETGSTKLILIFPEKKNKAISINAKIDYDKKTISLYGDVSDLTTSCFFIDKLRQKYSISLIRLNQEINLEVENIIYKKRITVVEFTLCNDSATKNQMQTIINNQIKIENSIINKSDIG